MATPWHSFELAPVGSAADLPVTAVSRIPSSMEVWWIAPNGSVQGAYWYEGGQWGRYELAPAGSAASAGITAVSRIPSSLEVWWIAPDGSVQGAYWYEGGQWGRYELAPADSAAAGGIAAVSRIPNSLEVWYIGRNGSVQDHYWYEGQPGWRGFEIAPPGSAAAGGIAAVSRIPNSLEVWYVGRNGSVQDRYWYEGQPGWRGFEIAPAGSAAPRSAIAAVSRIPQSLEIWYIGANGSVQDRYWYEGQPGWQGFEIAPAGSAAAAGMAAVSRIPESMEIWYLGAQGTVRDGYWYEQTVLRPDLRGLLASPGLAGQPLKGVYFFPGERHDDIRTYTTHPLDVRDEHWNTDTSTRGWVMDRMVRAHVNTVVMSYWSNMPQWSPMKIGPTTLNGVLDAVERRPLVVLPTIEAGFDADHPEIPHWQFFNEFPFTPGSFELAPGLVNRIGSLVELFTGRMHLWARMYDRDGSPRYAVHVLDVCSDLLDQDAPGADDSFAHAFDVVAADVQVRFNIPVGFTINPLSNRRYSLYPGTAGKSLERTASVLAIHGYMSEVDSSPPGLIRNGPPCGKDVDWRLCQPLDNNVDNLEWLADWKRENLDAWVRTRVPVLLDVSNGFDGRKVWAEHGAGFWGDNLDYTEDRWRNWMSQLKGPGIKGISVSTWNGYTEGYAAVHSREHGFTVYDWLTDLLEPPPTDYSHMHYVNGARTHRVYGAICEKWMQLGADRGFGSPVSDELPSTLGRMQYFAKDKAIYWSGATGAYEVHGIIERTYREEGGDASCLGLPVSDEEASADGRVSHFQRGRIDWRPGDTRGRVTCW